jgi:hypothetical protein
MTQTPAEIPQSEIHTVTLLKVSRLLLTLSCVVVAVVALSFLLLALPSNDDYIRATQPVKLGFWHYFTKLYLQWQGRWVSFGLESAILPHTSMTRHYAALIGPVLLIDLLGLYVVVRFFTRLGSRWLSLACTCVFATLLWSMMPSLAQTIYWFVGGIENTMVLALAGMLLVFLASSTPSSALTMAVAGVLAIVITGIHEMYGAMLCIALLAGSIAALLSGSEKLPDWIVTLLAAGIGMAIVVFAPGNRVRMVHDNSHHVRHLPTIFALAGKQFWTSGREWIFDPKLLAATLFVAFSPKLESARPVWVTASRVPWWLLIPLTWLAMLAIGFFMPSYAFVEPMPGRTLSGNYVIFATGWLLCVFIWTRRLDQRDAAPTVGLRNPMSAALAMVVLSFSLLLTGNTFEGLHDLATRKVFHWHASVEKRYALLRAPGSPDRVIPRLSPSSRLLYSSEIWIDPANWTNFSLADYFHLKSLRIELPAQKSPIASPTVDSPVQSPADNEKPGQNM